MKIHLISLFIIILIFSCGHENPKLQSISTKTPVDSIVVLKNENNKMICIYRFSNSNPKKLNEKITFLPNGEIDYSKSMFLQVIENDLVLWSPNEKQYPIPIKRYAQFIGWKITNDSIGNQTIKLDTTFFRENSKIENYLKLLPPKGKVLETLFLDTIIKSKGEENKTIIRTIEYDVDLRDLLIDKIKEL